ncbi:MAG: hypothetical protein C0430_09115 [Flavobacterium sp.]|nr:hypothetical protein [Flavobacterium sp.]
MVIEKELGKSGCPVGIDSAVQLNIFNLLSRIWKSATSVFWHTKFKQKILKLGGYLVRFFE